MGQVTELPLRHMFRACVIQAVRVSDIACCVFLLYFSVPYSLPLSVTLDHPYIFLPFRNSGLNPSKIPRPREGSRALDAVMLPLLDIEVGEKREERRVGH